MPPARVCVVGAGVIGVSSAFRILETCPGATVTLVSDKFSPNTTSDVSGGFWEPHQLGDTPLDKIRDWGLETLDYIGDLVFSPEAKDVGATLMSGHCMSDVPPDKYEHPFWRNIVYGYRLMEGRELQKFPGMKTGVFYTTVAIDVKLYLPWLMNKFRNKGGKIVQKCVNSLKELTPDKYDVIVNCTGVGSRALVDDTSVTPVRGQVIRVQAPWVKHFCIAIRSGKEQSTYILPGARCVVLGGTAQRGDWNSDVSLSDKTTILDNCSKYIPSLKGAVADMDGVGLRPTRPAVRLEREIIQTKGQHQNVVHNYGHGGAGVTLHWGCAGQTAQLVQQILSQKATLAKL